MQTNKNKNNGHGARGSNSIKGRFNATHITDQHIVTYNNGKMTSETRLLNGDERPQRGQKTKHSMPITLSFSEKAARGEIGAPAIHSRKFSARIVGNESKAEEKANYCETQKQREARSPFARLVATVEWRITTRGLSSKQREARPIKGKGSKGGKKTIIGYASGLSADGFTARKLSATDRAELSGAVQLAISCAPTDPRSIVHAIGLPFKGEMPPVYFMPGGAPIDPAIHSPECFPCRFYLRQCAQSEIKQLFTVARATLGIDKGRGKETIKLYSFEELCSEKVSGTAGEYVGISDQAIALQRALIDKREAESLRAEKDVDQKAILDHARHIAGMLRAARDAEKAAGNRKWKGNWKNAIAHLKSSLGAVFGRGHGHDKGRTAAYERAKTFRAYFASGERAIECAGEKMIAFAMQAVID